MRAAFVAITSVFGLLAALSLVKTATVVPDQPQVIRWLCACVAFAFIAVFWEITRRRYVARGTLRADPASAVLGVAALAVLTAMMIVHAVTA